MLARVGPHAGPFGAEDQRDPRRTQRFLEVVIGFAGESDPPDPVLAETAEIAADLTRMDAMYLSRMKAAAGREGAAETATP